MQGWRRKMEDAHLVTEVKLGGSRSALLAGVFDGHGGEQVSQFVQENFTKVFVSNLSSKKFKSYEEALKQSFLDLDLKIRNQSFGMY